MTAFDFTETRIKLTSPRQIAASIPFEFGFVPTQSVVCVFYAQSGNVIVSARIDAPQGVADKEVVERFLACLDRVVAHDIWGVVLVEFPGPRASIKQTTSRLAAIAEAATRSGLVAADPGYVLEGRWRSYLDDGNEQDPSESANEVLAVECQWVAQGASFVPTIDDVRRTIRGEPTALADAVAGLLAEHAIDAVRTVRARRALEDSLFDFVVAQPEVSRQNNSAIVDAITPEWLATVAVALPDSRVREPFLWRMVRHGQRAQAPIQLRDAVTALSVLTRNLPLAVVAPVASVTAAVAWQCGNGTVARLAAEYGQEADPRNVLSSLVLRAVVAGMPPTAWTQMMATMDVADLRSSRGRG